MHTVIMTGITSFIGSHTARELVNRGCQVSGIIRPNSRHLQVVENDPVLKKTRIVHADLGQLPAPEPKEAFLSECKDLLQELGTCDTWLHFAWDSDGEARSRKDPAIEDRNFEMAKKAFYLAQAAGAKCFVFAGSQAEYGNGTHEDPHPVSLYGKAKFAFGKWAQEQLAKDASAEKMRFIHLHIYSVYGYGDHETTLVNTLVRASLKREAFSLGPCTQMWNFMEVRDAAAAIALVSESGTKDDSHGNPYRQYDIAGYEDRRLKDYVLEINRMCGGGARLAFGTRGNNAEGAVDMAPDVSGLKALGFAEQFTFEDGIRSLRGRIEKASEDPELVFKPVKVEHLVHDKWIDFRRLCYEMPDGRRFEPFYNYSRRDFVVILARTKEGKFLCVKQYRNGLHKVTCEFPAGGIERSEEAQYTDGALGGCESKTALRAAKRELLEETGYISERWEQLLVEPAEATMSDNYAYIYFADECEKTGEKKLDETEFLKNEELDEQQIDGLVAAGMFEQAVHVMTWLLYKSRR